MGDLIQGYSYENDIPFTSIEYFKGYLYFNNKKGILMKMIYLSPALNILKVICTLIYLSNSDNP